MDIDMDPGGVDMNLVYREMNIMSEIFDDDLTDFFLNGDDIEDVERCNEEILEGLRKTCENFNWEVVEGRYSFFCSVIDLIGRWSYHWDAYHPDIRDIFRPEQIDYLLKESVINRLDNFSLEREQFIKFVWRANYTDQPDVDEDGRPMSRRTTPLHHVSAATDTRSVQYLFKIYNRVDVNYIDESGLTHFHVACWKGFYQIVDEFLELGQDPNLLVRETGDSPLHFAVAESFYREILVKTLLRKGANPNLANAKGFTALHVLCKEDYDEYYERDLVNTFFELSSENNHTVLIDARDNGGNTPLHWAAGKGNKYVVEYLLRHGADPNLANVEGLTPLHIICKRIKDDDLVDSFFDVNDDLQQTVRIDALDNVGMTPLKWAVVNLLPHVVDVLLDRGADMTDFAFPAADYFNASLDDFEDDYEWTVSEFLRQTSGFFAVVERLERRGYELGRSDALIIMTFFAKNGLFQNSENHANFQRCWHDEEFVETAREIMINPNLSLYELLQLPLKKAEKRVTSMEYFELACTKKLEALPVWRHFKPCVVHLCVKLARGFFRRWAVNSLLELTRYRLPILCCDAIVEQLTNKDLRLICMSVSVQNQ